MAYHGLGTYSFVDTNVQDLPAMVVKALKYAQDLALEKCTIQWNDEEPEELACVFRNQLIHVTQLLETPEQLNNLKFKFTVGKDPTTGQGWSLSFTKN